MGIKVEFRFVDQDGKEFWTDNTGRISYVKPSTLERACDGADGRDEAPDALTGGVGRLDRASGVTGRHEIDGYGHE